MTKRFYKIKELLIELNSDDIELVEFNNTPDNKILFSQQEQDILFYLVRGKTAKEIGKKLGLSYRTIEHRIEKIKVKVGVTSKSELIEKIFDKFK